MANKTRTICIIGAGASGLTAGIYAARAGACVTILERSEKPGKKIQASGNGKCNFTNAKMSKECYRSHSIQEVAEVLDRFGFQETLDFMESVGIYPAYRDGYTYPSSGQSSSVIEVLLAELAHLGAKLLTETEVTLIRKTASGFEIQAGGQSFCANAVILSCGSKAGMKKNAFTDGYALASALGHSVTPLYPALVQLTGTGKFLKTWSGVRTEGRVRILADEVELAADQGELQLTDYGISGIPVFQVSRFAAEALDQGKQVKAELDFFMQGSETVLYQLLEKRQREMEYKTLEELLVGIWNRKLIAVFLQTGGIPSGRFWSQMKAKEKDAFVHRIKQFRLPLTGTRGLSDAQVCAGGIPLSEICISSMESKKAHGLYLTGELLDVDGICGGYNLQWAWASGALAGKHAAELPESRNE